MEFRLKITIQARRDFNRIAQQTFAKVAFRTRPASLALERGSRRCLLSGQTRGLTPPALALG
jgi:hypothetical protein